MLGLTLRKEFQGRRLKGTAIELANRNRTGATQVPAEAFLRITYPSGDVLKAIEAIGPGQGRPLVLIGERGQGKSHVMAVLYHALTDTPATRAWLEDWGPRLGNPKVAALPLRTGMHVITESLHRQNYKFLWDVVLDQHPHGQWARGKWEGLGDRKTDVFPYKLLLELFQKQPTALILDEYQTWFDGLTNTKQYPWRNWAFNFIQNLSEIAKEHPEYLVLVVSVRNGGTDAFQQIQRVNPALVDFKGPHAKRDRQRLLLHRLFENRLQIPADNIRTVIATHVAEYIRLMDVPPDEEDKIRREFVEAWPFAPQVTELLEDQVLVATYAQETRDLIKILAELFKRQGEKSPIITPADFRLDDERSGVSALLDSVANEHHANLREKAQRNIVAVQAAVSNPGREVPHLSEIVGALWVRSLAVGNFAGAEPATLHVDITKGKPIDDNAFQVELDTIVENSFNIHREGNRLVFKEEENPLARLMASARNDKLFQTGEDMVQLAREIRYVIGGADNVARRFRVVVLPRTWRADPWGPLDDNDRPDRWDDRIPLLVLPECPENVGETLGRWLKEHLQSGRNTIRFLLPRGDSPNVYLDRTLLVLARAIYLASDWKARNPEYRELLYRHQKELRAILKTRYDRFAILETWHFQDPGKCRFTVSAHYSEGSRIPEEVDKLVRGNLFLPEDFEDLVLAAARENKTVGELLRELREPRPNQETCIPWLGETLVKEKLEHLCAKGKIAINLRGQTYLQVREKESKEAALQRMRGRLGTGKHLDETHLLLPQTGPQTSNVQVHTKETEGGAQAGLFAENTGQNGKSSGIWNGEAGTSTIAGTSTEAETGNGTEHKPGGEYDWPSNQGEIFGGVETFATRTASANSPLNLLAKVQDEWQITPGTQVRHLVIKVDALTGDQLGRLLKTLPDGMTYALDLEMEEN